MVQGEGHGAGLNPQWLGGARVAWPSVPGRRSERRALLVSSSRCRPDHDRAEHRRQPGQPRLPAARLAPWRHARAGRPGQLADDLRKRRPAARPSGRAAHGARAVVRNATHDKQCYVKLRDFQSTAVRDMPLAARGPREGRGFVGFEGWRRAPPGPALDSGTLHRAQNTESGSKPKGFKAIHRSFGRPIRYIDGGERPAARRMDRPTSSRR